MTSLADVTPSIKHPLYGTWLSMRRRCNTRTDKAYHRYGGRGIYVSAIWDDFATFARHMGPRPSPQHELDRIDNDGPYAPGNVRWATHSDNCRNRGNTLIVVIDGRSDIIRGWADRFGISISAVRNRVRKGVSVEAALTIPAGKLSDHGVQLGK